MKSSGFSKLKKHRDEIEIILRLPPFAMSRQERKHNALAAISQKSQIERTQMCIEC